MVITDTVASEKAKEKRSCQLDTNSTAAKPYVFKPSLNMMGGSRGTGKMDLER